MGLHSANYFVPQSILARLVMIVKGIIALFSREYLRARGWFSLADGRG